MCPCMLHLWHFLRNDFLYLFSTLTTLKMWLSCNEFRWLGLALWLLRVMWLLCSLLHQRSLLWWLFLGSNHFPLIASFGYFDVSFHTPVGQEWYHSVNFVTQLFKKRQELRNSFILLQGGVEPESFGYFNLFLGETYLKNCRNLWALVGKQGFAECHTLMDLLPPVKIPLVALAWCCWLRWIVWIFKLGYSCRNLCCKSTRLIRFLQPFFVVIHWRVHVCCGRRLNYFMSDFNQILTLD